jgi:hypothetical protein
VPSDFDPWPDEPDEDDPERRWGDPERDLTNVPEVDVPNSEPGDDVEVDSELATAFWVSVFFANVALAGLSIGAMLVYFRGDWMFGGAAFAVGLFALVRVYTYYRSVTGDDGDASEE